MSTPRGWTLEQHLNVIIDDVTSACVDWQKDVIGDTEYSLRLDEVVRRTAVGIREDEGLRDEQGDL